MVDIDPARAAEAAAQYGCEGLTDFRQLAGKADAAIVAVPTSAHMEVGCGLMEAGIDVLVEKPIAPDLASADRLLRDGRGHRAHPAGGPPGALQSGGAGAGKARHAAAVLRDPPHERVQPARRSISTWCST